MSPTKKQCLSSDSETNKELSRELGAVLAEPEDPVKLRLNHIRKNRKKAEENRVKRIRKRHEEEMLTEIAAELDEMPLCYTTWVNGLNNLNVRMR